MNEQDLVARLRAIQALYHGATTVGEAEAAARAWERVSRRLEEERAHALTEQQFSLSSSFQRRLFMALARKHGIEPYRYKRQRYNTVMLRASQDFVDKVLWPEFQQLSDVLQTYLDDITTRVIAEAVHADSSDASAVRELEG